MKSFHVYLEPPAPPKPERCVRDYATEEQVLFRDGFRPLAGRYRRYRRVGIIASLLCFGLGLPVLATQENPSPWLYGPLLLCLAVYAVITVLVPVPKCPACHNRLDQGFGVFCPECGAEALKRSKWPLDPRCSACARTMSRGRSRHYKIHACTHCGVQLDEEGF